MKCPKCNTKMEEGYFDEKGCTGFKDYGSNKFYICKNPECMFWGIKRERIK